ncbi:RNA polymerase sigma factor [Ilumatobacter nonamiensis]|uniref:RNA polymerase sigma factor n=1 Tax=Ilumatobacter nonamiensis TaxID=467093 RepID=UPI000345736F|nr:sigma-70 family RNA polymerase sigma factor [Ilumatobacter nonamiensis]
MDPGHDAQLVERVRSGDPTAFAPLFERWYDRAYNVARGVVRRPELAADVTQDAFVAAWQQLDRLDDVNAFGGWLLRITRNRALDAIRREGRSTATDDTTVVALHDRGLPNPVAATSSPGPAAAAELQEQEQLLWAAAAALGERDASVLDLHLRHGLTPAELAEDLGVAPNHAHQLVHRLRQRLGDAIGAFLLWNRGAPRCADLAGSLGSTFDADIARIVKRHLRTCSACSEERERQTDPTRLFATVPFALAPLAFRARTAFALEQAGAPMPTGLTAPRAHAEPTPTDPDAQTIRFEREDTDTDDQAHDRDVDTDGLGPDSVGHPEPGLPTTARAGRVGRRVALAAAAVVVLLGCGALLVLSMSSAPEGATSAIASPTSTDLAAPAPSTTVPSTTTMPPSTTSTTTSTTTTTVPAPTTTAPPPVVLPPPPVPPSDNPPAPPPPIVPPAADPPPAAPTPGGTDTPPPPPPDTTLPPPPPPPPAPPTIQRLSIVAGSSFCVTPTQPATVRWITDQADSAELQWNGQSEAVAVDGDRALCLEPGDTVTLIARNAGGNTSRSTVF